MQANRSWTFEVNGHRLFAKGANWVPCDLMLGKCTRPQYEYLLTMAAHGNHNFLRIWGGGGIEKPEFFEVCDKLGILVVQEMVHSQAMPQREANFVAESQEIKNAVRKLRSHVSLVRWGWGNEFYGINRTSSRFERQFEEIVERLDSPDSTVYKGRRAIHGSPVTWAQRQRLDSPDSMGAVYKGRRAIYAVTK